MQSRGKRVFAYGPEKRNSLCDTQTDSRGRHNGRSNNRLSCSVHADNDGAKRPRESALDANADDNNNNYHMDSRDSSPVSSLITRQTRARVCVHSRSVPLSLFCRLAN